MLFQAFVTYVRPLLEFNCQVWSPSYSMLVNKIECAQRKFTKRLRGLSIHTYTERLHSFGADSLELRRLKLDVVMLDNIIHSNVDVDLAMFHIIDSDLVRSCGHPLRIVKSHCRINTRLYSFVPRSINIWNSLPERLVKCGTVQTFRRSDVTLTGLN